MRSTDKVYMPRQIFVRIRELLAQHFPNSNVRLQDVNSIKETLLAFPLNDRLTFNFIVNIGDLLDALENKGPFTDKYDFFKKANIPRWHVDHYNDKLKEIESKH